MGGKYLTKRSWMSDKDIEVNHEVNDLGFNCRLESYTISKNGKRKLGILVEKEEVIIDDGEGSTLHIPREFLFELIKILIRIRDK